MVDEQSAELTEPDISSFDDRAAFVVRHLSIVFMLSVSAVFAGQHDQLDATLSESLGKRIGVVGAIADYPLRLLPGAAFGALDEDLAERGFRKHNFYRRHFRAALPVEDPGRRPVPSTSFPCRALDFPTAESLFRRSEAAIQKRHSTLTIIDWTN